MRKYKFALALLLIMITLIPFGSICSYTDTQDAISKEIQWLVNNKFLLGSNGTLRLNETLTRDEASVMIVRVLGVENLIKEEIYQHPFTDVQDWSTSYIGYLYINGITNGVNTTQFGSKNLVSMQQYVALILRALGYKDSFTYENALNFAKQINLLTSEEISKMSIGAFTRKSMAEVTFNAMQVLINGKETLAIELMNKGVITKEALDTLAYLHIPTSKVTGALTEITKIPKQKVLVLNYDPILEDRNGIRLHDLMNFWNDPRDLVKSYITDFAAVTNNYVQYEIVDWIDVDEFTRDIKGFKYTDKTYLEAFDKAVASGEPYYTVKFWHPANDKMDYEYYLKTYNILNRVQAGEIDEVWLFSGPCNGIYSYETQMIGEDAYWCNSPPIQKDGVKPFVFYYFNFERGVDCMLENSGHRLESTMWTVYGRWDYNTPFEQMNLWERFSLYDKVLPGKAACGNVHFAPNSERDYDWGNMKNVKTTYVDWVDYPYLSGDSEIANTLAWGGGDMRLHHIWWFGLIPKAQGINSSGFYNNWWNYYVYPTYFLK